MNRFGVESPAGISLQLLARFESSGYDVIEIRMDRGRVQRDAGISLLFMSFALVRSILRMGAQCRIPEARVAESKATAAGCTLATAVRHSRSVGTAVSNC